MVIPKPPRVGPTEPTEGFYDALGHTIKVARTDLGIERKDLADRAGISYSYLAAIENGQKQPSSQVLIAIAEALGLRTHELLESAEGRRDRNLNESETYPGWLTGMPQRVMSRRAAFEMADASGPAPMAAAAPPPPQDWDAELRRHRDFINEIDRLTRHLDDSERRLLLEMAERFGRS